MNESHAVQKTRQDIINLFSIRNPATGKFIQWKTDDEIYRLCQDHRELFAGDDKCNHFKYINGTMKGQDDRKFAMVGCHECSLTYWHVFEGGFPTQMRIELKEDNQRRYDYYGYFGQKPAVYRVYRNLHTGTWSLLDQKTKKVVGHPSEICLQHVSFIVNHKGRQRVIKEKSKNVHAFVQGFISYGHITDSMVEVTYNPYKYSSFVVKDTEKPINKAKLAIFTPDMKVFVSPGES